MQARIRLFIYQLKIIVLFLLRIRLYNLIHVTKLIREPPHSGFRRPLFCLELLFDHRLALGQTQEKPERQPQLIHFILLPRF